MQNNPNGLVWGGILIAIVIAIASLFIVVGSNHAVPQSLGSTVNGGNVTDYTAVNTTAGYWVNGVKVIDSSGNFIGVSTITVNGVVQTFARQSLSAATTTPCSLVSPASTSTLVSYGWNITTATSSAGTFQISTSSTAYSTTTAIASVFVVPANQTRSFQIPTTTPATFAVGAVFAPSTYVVAGVSGVSYGYTYGGTCQAVWQSLN